MRSCAASLLSLREKGERYRMFLSREPLQALEALGRLSVAEERDVSMRFAFKIMLFKAPSKAR